jgi:hypothetical protein
MAEGGGAPALIGFCAATGAGLGEVLDGTASAQDVDPSYVTGFFVGTAVGVSLWLLIGALVDRNHTLLAFTLTIVGGGWVGAAVGGLAMVLPGAFWGSAVFLGWLLHRVIWDAHVRSTTEHEIDDEGLADDEVVIKRAVRSGGGLA